MHQSYLQEHGVLNRQRLESMARPCLDAVTPVEIVLVTYDNELSSFIQSDGAAVMRPQDSESKRTSERIQKFIQSGTQVVPHVELIALDDRRLRLLDQAYAFRELELKEVYAAAGFTPRSVSEASQLTRQIIPFPNYR
jgi:hypothetical protein